MQFAVSARAWVFQEPGEAGAQAVGRAYLWECLGFIVGGTVFSFMLVFANEFRVAAIVAILNLGVALLVLCTIHGSKLLRVPVGIAVILFPAWLFFNSASLQQQTSQSRFPGETLLQSQNTVHGNVSVTQLGKQYNFYQSGLLLGADREDLASEYLVHFPMLAHPAPRKVLLLGTGFNGPIKQILKYDPQEVLVVELDPELLKIVRGYLPGDLQDARRDPRVKIQSQDPLAFLKSDAGVFEVIIANFPDPVSVLINRNYTEQFFRRVRSHLAPGGVFATHITFAANSMTPETERLGSSVYATLGQVFPSVKVLPEDTLFFLASADAVTSWDAEKMIQRFSERGIKTDFVTTDLIRYRFENDRVLKVTTAFRNALWKIKNTALWPRTCYFTFLRWLSQFDPHIASLFFVVVRVPFPVVLGACLLMVLFLSSFVKGPRKRMRRLAWVSMGTAGFSLMAFEVLGIYLFQAAFGNLYYRLSWVITVFMVGLGAGTWGALRSWKVPERYALAGLHAMNAAFFFFLVKACGLVFSGDPWLGGGLQLEFLGTALLGGFVTGAVFPFANRFYLRRQNGTGLGHIYAADLLGSSLGALLTAGFLIPLWGVLQTLILLGAMNALLAFLLFRKRA